jgi:diguanylate cyclase (GGDEF)-like protein
VDPASRRLTAAVALVAMSVVGYELVPAPETTRQLWYDVSALAAVAIGFAGLAHHRPLQRRGWALVLTGYAGWVVGDVAWTVEQHVLPGVYPAPSDAVYLASYAALGAGVLALVRPRRGGRDVAALLDASIVAAGAAVLIAVLILDSITADSQLSALSKAVIAAYPVGDVFLLGVIVRLYAAPGSRTASYRWLAASLVLTTGADLAWNIATLLAPGSALDRWTNLGWLLSYLCAGAAATVPSMRAVAEPAPDREPDALSRRRLAVLAGGLLLPAVALLLDGADGGEIQWQVIGVGSAVLSLLVLVRMAGLLSTVQVQAVRLAALARSDGLTGAPNRRTWDHELSRACLASREHGSPLHVAMLDFDRFKAFNDAHGHQAGDRLLRETVDAWSATLREDHLLARYGGEEFAVLMPDTALHEAMAGIAALRAVTPEGQTFSAGVAAWDPATDPGTVVAWADEALYRAKRAGRDRVVAHAISQTLYADPRLPELIIVTQPIVYLASGRVVAHEALSRFPTAQAEVHSVFVRAHRQGYGDLLELEAIRAAMGLPGRPAGNDLFVNASTAAMSSPRFWEGLPDDLRGIVFEVTESEQPAPTGVAEQVERLRSRGARIALDDLGTGASDLAWLAELRPDVIKIDKSLVQESHRHAGRRALLRSLGAYGDAARAHVCAEGVETDDDLRGLTRLGITHAQGYLLGRPGPQWQPTIAQPVPGQRAPTGSDLGPERSITPAAP